MPPSLTPTRRFVLRQILACIAVFPARAEAAVRDGFRILEAREGSLQLLPEPAAQTPVLTYDGLVPGPLLRGKQGDEFALRLVNKLDRPVTFSLQGLRVPNAMAGVAGLTQSAVAPGQSFDYRFTARDAGLSWYQSHVLPETSEQLGRGLYGALIVDEPKPPVADKDMLILLADWSFEGQARRLVGASAEGRVTSRLTVNSLQVPLLEVLPPRSRVRLRIVSTVSAQVLPIGFTGTRPVILAVDGAPCEAFEPARKTIPVGPGALYDVMLDLPSEPGMEVRLALPGDGETGQPLVTFTTQGEPRAELPPIASLEPNTSLPRIIELEAARRADLVIEAGEKAGHWKLNGVAATGFPAKPLFSVKRGTPVSLGFVNRTSSVHQMRVHGHYLRILHDLDDGWEPYWRNGVLVPPAKTKRVAFVADAPGKWAIEGLMHESRSFGLATWFEVT
jgi:FtsP/CotA-like multicopper oxidase with cupredoxin domain